MSAEGRTALLLAQRVGSDLDAFHGLGRVESGSYRALVLPGAYEIVYDGLSSFSSLHDGVRNSQYPLGSVVVTSSMTLDVDVPATRLTGRLTVDGGFRSGLRHSRIVLRRVGSEDEAALGDVPIRAEVYGAWVVPGRYNVVHVIPRVSSVVSGEVRNTAAILGCVVVP